MHNSDQDTIDRLSALLGRDRADVESLMEGLSTTIRDFLTDGQSIAIPSFGTFDTVKEDEHITTDLVTGERLLVPPCITPVFRPSTLLRRRITNPDQQ